MGNFDGVIQKFRADSVSSVWFLKDDNKEDLALLDDYNKVAGDLKGMAKIAALSCTDFPGFCEKQGLTATPHVTIYPINPMPAFKYEGKLEAKAIAGKVSKFMPDLTHKLAADMADG